MIPLRKWLNKGQAHKRDCTPRNPRNGGLIHRGNANNAPIILFPAVDSAQTGYKLDWEPISTDLSRSPNG